MLCRDYYTPPEGKEVGTGRIQFNRNEDPPLYYCVNDVMLRVGMECEFEWTLEITEQPVSILTYEQGESGALAWVAEVIHESPTGRIVIRMPIIKSGNNYIVNSFYTELPEDTKLSFDIIKKPK